MSTEVLTPSLPLAGARRAVEAALLLSCPVAAFLLFRWGEINQAGYLDPWLYTGYIFNFEDLLARHGWRYYAVRFPFIAPAMGLAKALGPETGYLVLRYLAFLLAALPLYVLSKRRFGVAIAAAGYAFLLCNPLLIRVLLWDYVLVSAIPCLLAGFAFWYLERRVLAGLCLALALHSHFFTVTVIGLFFGVEAFLSWREGRDSLRKLAHGAGLAALGGLLASLAGYAFYYGLTGNTDPWTLLQPTLDAVRAGQEAQAGYKTSYDWMRTQYYAYLPLLLLGALVLMGGGGAGRIEARIALFLAAGTGFYVLYEFLLGGYVFEYFFYFAFLTPALFLAFPLLLHRLSKGRDGTGTAALLAFALTALFHAFWADGMRGFYAALVGSPLGLPLFSSALLAALGLVFWSKRQTHVNLPAALGLVVLLQWGTFSFPHFNIFWNNLENAARERAVYRAALDSVRYVPRQAEEPGRLWFWTGKDAPFEINYFHLAGFSSLIGSGAKDLSELGEAELARFREHPDTRFLILLGGDEQRAAGVKALERHGLSVRRVREEPLGPDFPGLRALVLEVLHNPFAQTH